MSNGRLYHWKGEELYLNTICNREGVSYTAIKQRILRGMTLEEAMNCPKRKYTHHVYDLVYNGLHWNARQLADELGVPRNWFYEQLNGFITMSNDEKNSFQEKYQITVELKGNDIHN